MSQLSHRSKVVIVGGGFGGVRTALDLARYKDLDVVLISNKSHFEYQAALYRVVAGGSDRETRVPLVDIFSGTRISVKQDYVSGVDLERRVVYAHSGLREGYDFLVLALGSETNYFDIPGLAEFSFGFKSSHEANKLKEHIESALGVGVLVENREERVSLCHIVIVGGGPSGVELAGELALFTRRLAKKLKLDPGLVTIDLFEAESRLLPVLPEVFAEKVRRRLHSLGINIFLGRALVREEIGEVFLKDMQVRSKTVIWTAGVRANSLYRQIPGLTCDRSGRVIVNDFLQPPGFPNVFIVGDGASIQYSGMAQTAVQAGAYAARHIAKRGRLMMPFRPTVPIYSIPVGPGWAATWYRGIRFYGRVGWFLRRAADRRFFWSILPIGKFLRASL